MEQRGVEVREVEPGRFEYEHAGVSVAGMPPRLEGGSVFVTARVAAFQPDVVIASGDPRYYLLGAALDAAPDRVVYVAHSHEHVPFGPLSRQLDDARPSA